MAIQGSNELNALLKAKVVKIRVELDYKNSKLPTQVNNISKWLKDQGKTVKLGVKLDLSVKDFNSQISAIHKMLASSKTSNPSMKLKVDIDVAGSAKTIKKQLNDVYKTVQDFNKQYGQQIKHMQQVTNSMNGQGNTAKKTASAFGVADPSLYVQSLKEAEKYMRNFIGNKKGLFSSTEMKDASGQVNGFIATLTNANGVVNKIHYQWNQQAKTFAPINQTTVTETQKSVAKAKQSLMSLYADIQKLKDGSSKTNLLSQFDELEKRASHMTLNDGMVKNLQRQIKEENVLQQQVKDTNNQYAKQEELIRKITASMNKFWSKADKTSSASVNIRNQYKDLVSSVKTNPTGDFKAEELELRRINDLLERQAVKEREIAQNTKLRMSYLRQVEQIERKTISTDRTSNTIINEIKLLSQRAKTGKEWLVIAEKMNKLKMSNANDKDLQKNLDLQYKIQKQLEKLRDLGKLTEQQFTNSVNNLHANTTRGTADLERMLTTVSRKVTKVQDDMKRLANQSKDILSGGSSGANRVKSLVDSGNITELQRYLGELYKGKVQTVAMRETTDQLGRAVTEMKVKMAGAGKEVQTYTVQMERANGALRQTGQGMEYNANRNLGVFEQLRIAIARVPVWMVAMTAFYGTINSVKQMTQEILKLDSALTEIRRVASDSISVDSLFKSSVSLSKELGNNVHDILGSVGEMARTFGDFNERQLIAITRTATLMSNVSDLTTEEASNNLVGTMNAFNISAEESIHIVDALNEVDNNYAISTKQLSEGLTKSASTAKTYGVTLEENIGHITAIGAVTMESGAIIGNSLKTIYSRITTIESAKTALSDVGVAIADQKGDVREVEDILTDLGSRWNDISDAQRQNIGVQVAGRYQLSRFLALMNNWEMASEATTTAIYSEGSAMRENAEYMKSFEARINQLKNGWTELSNAVGNAILSDGLMLVIGLLKGLAEAGVWVADNFGALPAILIPVVGILGKMGILDKIFSTIVRIGNPFSAMTRGVGTATLAVTTFRDRLRDASASGVGRIGALRTAWNGVTTAEAGATIGVRTFALALKSMLVSTVIGGAIVALGWAIEKITSKIAESKRQAEETESTYKKMIEAYRSHSDGMADMVTRYEQLTKKTSLSSEEQEELNTLIKDFANELPTTVAYIDANGEAHLRTTEEIKKEIQAVKQLSEENAKLEMEKFDENLNKQAKSYNKITKEIEKLRKKQKDLKKEDGETKVTTYGYGIGMQANVETVDNSTKIQESKVEMLKLEAEKTEAINGTIEAIQKQALAYFEANGKLGGLGDNQQKLIEEFVSSNESMLRFTKDFDKTYNDMYDMGLKAGDVFSQAFEILSKGVENQPDKIAEIKTALGDMANSVPSSFLKITDESGKVVKSVDEVVAGLKEVINVGNISGNQGVTYEQLEKRLRNVGFTAEEANKYIIELAKTHDNASLRAEAQKQSVDGLTGSMEDLNEVTIEAVDLTGALFGYSKSDVSSMLSNLQAMKNLIDLYGKSVAKGSDDFKTYASSVAEYLNVTDSEVIDNLEKYTKIAEALSSIDWTSRKDGQSLQDFVKGLEDVDKSTKDLLNTYFNSGAKADIFSGDVRTITTNLEENTDAVKDNAKEIFDSNGNAIESYNDVGDAVDNASKKVKDSTDVVKLAFEEMFYTLKNSEGEEVVFTNLIKGSTEVIGSLDEVKRRYDEIQNHLNTSTGNKALDDLIGQLSVTDGKMDGTRDNILILKQILENDANVKILDGFNESVDKTKKNVDELNDKKVLNENDNSPEKVKEEVDSAKKSLDGMQRSIQLIKEEKMFNDGDDSATVAKGKIDKTKESVDDLGLAIEDFKINHAENIGASIKTDGAIEKVNKLSEAIKNATNSSDLLFNLESVLGNTTGMAIDLVKKIDGISANFKNISDVGKSFGEMKEAVNLATEKMLKAYGINAIGVENMVKDIKGSLDESVINIDKTSSKSVDKIDSMTAKMHTAFKDGIKDIVTTAGTLPKQVGDAVRKNMKDATDSMDALAKDMVKRFKSELGIHSPSRVFTDLGGWVVKGLVNGLTGHDLKSLGKDVFDDFGGGIFDSWDMIKAYVSGDFSNIAGGSVEAFAPVATKALLMTNQYSEANLQRLLMQMQSESGGNPKAINLWDSNAKAGIPSKGLMQVIDPTFQSYAMAGYNSNIYDPLSNILASIRYALARYGSLANAYQGHGYANGGIVTEKELAWHGEEGAEAIIPLIPKRRSRGLELWSEAGQRLGIDPKAIAWLERFYGKKSGSGIASGGVGSFGASSGEGGGEGGGSNSGTSGTLVSSSPSIIGTHTYDGGYDVMALASNYKEEKAEAYKSNSYEKKQNDLATQITLLNTAMEAMDKTSTKYRDTLLKINALENKRVSSLNSENKSLESRNKTVEKELRKLPSLSKQSVSQREKYNSLKQEYDENIQRIQQIKTEVASTAEEVRQKSIEVFTNFIDEIVEKYDGALNTIKQKVDNADFQISLVGLTDPDNQTKLLNAQIDKALALQSQQATAYNKQNATKSQYNSAVNKYGSNSDQAKKAKEAYEQSVKDYQEATLAILNAEKEIKDTREGIAEDGINALKDYYKNMQQMATDAIDKEKAQLQKAHEDKLKMYDDEVNAINAVYDAKFKQMDEEEAQENYNEQLAEKNAKKAELVNKIALLSRDTSTEGKKRLAELQAELADANKDIADFQKERERELTKQALQAQQEEQLNAINGYTDEQGVYHEGLKDKENNSYDDSIAKLDEEKEAVSKKYEDLINNEQHWEEIRNNAIKGSFTTLNTELTSMTTSISNMNKGIFDGLTANFKNFSDEVKKQVAEANALTVENMAFANKEPVSNVKEASKADSYTAKNGAVQSGKATNVSTPKQKTPASTSTSKPSTSTSKTSTSKSTSSSTKTEYYTIKKGDTFWDIESKYGLTHGTLAKLNPDVNPNKLKIGQKIILKKGTSSSSSSKSNSSSSNADRKTTSALNFRSSARYGNNVMMTIPKGAKVDYVGMEKGWAKIKYKGKTGYVGSQYLKKFDTGGYTGNDVPKEGAIALLHRKELVLNENQTKDILDTAKIMDKIKGLIPEVSRGKILDKLASASEVVTNVTYGDIYVTVQGGDKKKSKDIAKELMNEIKKKGR